MPEQSLDELKRLSLPALRHAELVNLARTESPNKAYELASVRWPRRQAKATRFLAMVRRNHGPEALEAFIMEHAQGGSMSKTIVCRDCDGSGRTTKCEKCDGQGTLMHDDSRFYDPTAAVYGMPEPTCDACGGTKVGPDRECVSCCGYGKMLKTPRLVSCPLFGKHAYGPAIMGRDICWRCHGTNTVGTVVLAKALTHEKVPHAKYFQPEIKFHAILAL